MSIWGVLGIFSLGLALGAVGAYFLLYRPVWESREKLTDILAGMKKQGFVRQYEVEQPKERDPSEGIPEY